jgi:GNAT superfamily N-acetyltransferase
MAEVTMGLEIAEGDTSRLAEYARVPSLFRIAQRLVRLPSTSGVLGPLSVAPEHRREHVGEALFRAAERWAQRNAFRAIAVETQDVNVAAARFYEAMGCVLLSFESDAYPDVPGEGRLVFHRRLSAERAR